MFDQDDISGSRLTIFYKSTFGDHKADTKTIEMGTVTHLLNEDIIGVDDARDMINLDSVIMMVFTDLIFEEIEVIETFGSYGSRPIDASLVIVIDNIVQLEASNMPRLVGT